jgi:hypothetical protein
MKMPGIAAVFFEELAEVENEIIDCAGGGINIVAPYDLQYLLAGNDFAFVLNQQLQQGGFLLAQLLCFLVLIYTFMRCKVDAAAIKLIDVVYSLWFLDPLILGYEFVYTQ